MQISVVHENEPFKPINVLLTIESPEELYALYQMALLDYTVPAVVADENKGWSATQKDSVRNHLARFFFKLNNALRGLC